MKLSARMQGKAQYTADSLVDVSVTFHQRFDSCAWRKIAGRIAQSRPAGEPPVLAKMGTFCMHAYIICSLLAWKNVLSAAE